MKPFKPLRMLLAEKEIGQYELARRARIAESTFCDRLAGKRPFTAWEMDRIAQVLDIDRADYHRYFFEPTRRG